VKLEKEKEAKKREEARKREAEGEEKERENQFPISLFHQNLPPLEYKSCLNKLTTNP
jgi:hypothetical protein